MNTLNDEKLKEFACYYVYKTYASERNFTKGYCIIKAYNKKDAKAELKREWDSVEKKRIKNIHIEII
jgi:hypothetical protein